MTAYRTFADLEKSPQVSAQELREVLEDYAQSGACIAARVVIALIEKCSLTVADKAVLVMSARKGMRSQAARNFSREAAEYEKVIQHLVKES